MTDKTRNEANAGMGRFNDEREGIAVETGPVRKTDDAPARSRGNRPGNRGSEVSQA